MYCYFLRLQKLPLFRELFRALLVIGLGAKFSFVGIFKFLLERKGISLLFHLTLFSSLTIQRIDLIALIAFSFQMDVLPCLVRDLKQEQLRLRKSYAGPQSLGLGKSICYSC